VLEFDLFIWLMMPFVVLVAAGFGLHPIPEEAILTWAGVHTAGETRFGVFRWLMLPVCILGSLLADVALYWGGRLFGSRLRRSSWLARVVPQDKREHTERNFRRYGVSILVIGRLVPGIRTTLFVTAGMMRLSMPQFLLADGIGACFGNSLFFLLGFWLGDQFAELIQSGVQQVSVARPLLLVILLLGVSCYLVYLFIRRPIPTGDPEELPLIGHQVAVHLPHQEGNEDKIPQGVGSGGEHREASATGPPEG
jgi:membrane protein DedA with SNARE-associated domain